MGRIINRRTVHLLFLHLGEKEVSLGKAGAAFSKKKDTGTQNENPKGLPIG